MPRVQETGCAVAHHQRSVAGTGRPRAGGARLELRAWKQRLQPQLAQQPETLEALRLRLAQVERENLQLRQQRDILKTLGIVSTT